MISEART